LTSPVATASTVRTAQPPAPIYNRINDFWESQRNITYLHHKHLTYHEPWLA